MESKHNTILLVHWGIDDPVVGGSEETQLEAFRRAQDDWQRRIQSFVSE